MARDVWQYYDKCVYISLQSVGIWAKGTADITAWSRKLSDA